MSGGDSRLRQLGILVPEREFYPDPQGCYARHDHGRPRRRQAGQTQHAGACDDEHWLSTSRSLTSVQVTIAVSIIAVGTAVASWGELAFSMLGFIIMVTSEFCEALKLAAMQYMLGNLKLNLMEGIYYLTPAGFLWMCFFILPLELSRMMDEGAADIVFANMPAFVLAATLGFFVNLLSYGVIQTTSSLTFKVLGQLKNVAVVVASCVIFGNRVSGLQALGYAIAIIGFALYNKAKSSPLPPASSPSGALGSSVPAGLSDKAESPPAVGVPLVNLTGSATNLVELGEASAPGSARYSMTQRGNAHVRQGSLSGEEGKAGDIP